MIKVGTILKVADNSGAKRVACIRILGSKKSASIGDVIVVSVKQAVPNAKIAAGTVQRAVVVRIKKSSVTGGDSHVLFDDNAAILINKQSEIIGTRILGPVHNRLRYTGFLRIISLCSEVVQ